MTQDQIQRQIEIIREVSTEILKSKETARQFLIDARIIEDKKKKKASPNKK